MGFCRRCGEITTGERCKCGGTSRDSTTKLLFGASGSDKWSQRYLARSPSTSPGNTSPIPTITPSSPRIDFPPSASRTPAPPPSRPTSPSKLAHSFLHQQDDRELSCVFGSVLSPKDHWQCAACRTKFRQEEVIYPHPDAKGDPKLAELYYCRQCFAERFRKGNCKKCQLAVLSDAPFIKHGKTLWHESCYTCSYCTDPSTSPVIDFAGRPSCEACFDAEAYKARGIAPSPHLSQSEFRKQPVSVPPAPSKWGRPSISSSSPPKKANIFSASGSKTAIGLGVSTAIRADEGQPKPADEEKGKAWSVRLQREKSPMAPSFDELAERLRKAGLTDLPRPLSPTKPSTAPTSTPSSPSKRSPLPPTPTRSSSPAKNAVAPWSSHASTTLTSTAPRRPVLAPLQNTGGGSSRSVYSPSSPSKLSQDSLRPFSPSPQRSDKRVLTSTSTSAATSSPAAEETCPVCKLELGYGQFIELRSGEVLHRGCFTCGGCGKTLEGKYIEAEEKTWHKECAPAPRRYRTIITSLAEDPSPSSPTSPAAAETPLTAELPADDPCCYGCGKLLGYGHSVTIPRSGRSFHTACFTCAKCSGVFGEVAGQKGFIEVLGLPYHDKCAPPPASPSPSIRSSPFFAAQSSPSSTTTTSRSTRPPSLPSLSSFPPKYLPPPPLSPSKTPTPTLFATRQRPPAGLGGLLVCAGCSVRATEKETVTGPVGRRYHAKCLKCGMCARGLDSECRVGSRGELRCESCRKTEARASYRRPASSSSATSFAA
ncbi:hypothetical protein JCM1840_002549 [Sporobolomyces johnsonii]